MRLRIAAFAAAVALIALTLTGCNRGASNTGSTNGANSTNINTAGPVESPVFGEPKASATATPTESTSTSTPTEVFKAYYEAIKRKDAAAVKKLFSKATLKTLEEQARRANKSFDEVFKEGFERVSKDIPQTVPESRNEKIDGMHATLEVRNDTRGTWDTATFIKEDGQWKISFADADRGQAEVK